MSKRAADPEFLASRKRAAAPTPIAKLSTLAATIFRKCLRSPLSVLTVDFALQEQAALAPADIKLINSHELQHLRNVRGHIEGQGPPCGYEYSYLGYATPKRGPPLTNSCGVVDCARLLEYDSEARVLQIRVDSMDVPTFWLDIQLPLDQVAQFIAQQPTRSDALGCLSQVKGFLEGHDENDKVTKNTLNNVDGARLVEYDPRSRRLEISIRSSEVPTFWMEIPLFLDQVDQYVASQTPFPPNPTDEAVQ